MILTPMDTVPINVLVEGFSPSERKSIVAALSFVQRYLSSVFRRSGQNYALHGMEVARTVREAHAPAESVMVAILHDVLMHPDGNALLESAPLSSHQKSLVRHMHSLRRLHIDEKTEDLDRVIEAFMENPTVLLLRMAHRLNDVRSLQRFSQQLRRSIARETLHMYSAIAGRLGLHLWRHEMEDICFMELEPKAAAKLEERFADARSVDLVCLEQTMRYLKTSLRTHGIHSDLSFRVKGLYSSYQKMILKNRRFEELTDRLAIRIVVPDTDSCYRTLGIVHERMHPIPGKLKDYIGAPKQNGYRSIHTVVYPLPGITEKPIEIQIRTASMDGECEMGIAAHWDYKKLQYALTTNNDRVDLFRNLSVLRAEVHSPEQFEKVLRNYFRSDHLVVFDTLSNMYELPKPATGLDFVAHVFAKRIVCLKEIRINGRQRPLSTVLNDGDTVEARFGRSRNATKEWLRQCHLKSSRALLRKIETDQLSASTKETLIK